MTAKLKKKLKLIGLTASAVVTIGVSILASLTAKNSDLFSMPANAEETTINKSNIQILGDTIVCDSLVQGVRDVDLPDGTYIFRVTGKTTAGAEETKDYLVEFKNEYNDVVYTSNQSLGDTTTERKTLVVKYHKNLTIEKGVTVTATAVSNLTYKKGMYLCVMGKLTNKGTITMTARGTYNQAGENVYLWKNTDGSFEYVPATGGAGGAAVKAYNANKKYTNSPGIAGTNGNDVKIAGTSEYEKRATGGGGSGASCAYRMTTTSGAGSAGTSYSGGSGGGGIIGGADSNSASSKATNASPNGGSGGKANTYRASSGHSAKSASGGAGNTGGKGVYSTGSSLSAVENAAYNGGNGTGGLLIIYAGTLNSSGTISSQGSNAGSVKSGYQNATGGSSGGGSINIFANTVASYSTITATGGNSRSGGSAQAYGGNGGNGTITVMQVMPDLVYKGEKVITLNVGDNYDLDRSNLIYINQNLTQIGNVPVGNISFEALDASIASISNTGKIFAEKEGKTKVKITDENNGVSTYIYVEVINNTKIDVEEGKNFTVALKKNGTVWSYGLNDKGQLGIGNDEDISEPVQVINLEDIKAIASGYSHSLALGKNRKSICMGARNKWTIRRWAK